MLKEDSRHIKWDRLVSNQVVLWDIRRKLEEETGSSQAESPWAGSFITISRTHGAGGDEIAAEIGRILDWQVYDRELVEYIAETANVRQRVVESLDERRQSEIENWMQTLLSHQMLGTDKYLKHLISVLLAIAEHGRAVIIGRGSNFVLASGKGLRVLITAPLEWRAEQLAQKRKISIKEAKKNIRKVDDERLAYIRRYFRRDANDPTAYDLVLNVMNMSKGCAARIIISALAHKIGITNPNAVQTVAA